MTHPVIFWGIALVMPFAFLVVIALDKAGYLPGSKNKNR